MITLGELVMILDLNRQGLSVSAIARQLGLDGKTVRKHIEHGLVAPAYGPRSPCPQVIDPFLEYLRKRVAAYPNLSGRRLQRELKERGYGGGHTVVTETLCDIRLTIPAPFEVRFETPAGKLAKVDFARFQVVFQVEPGVVRIVWLFSLVLGHSWPIFARFVERQDLQTLLRCHAAAFEAIGGSPRESLDDHTKTAIPSTGENGHIVYNRSLIDFTRHYGFQPKAFRLYGAKTKGKV